MPRFASPVSRSLATAGLACTALAALATLAAFAADDEAFGPFGTRYRPDADAPFPRVEYEHGGPTLNERCPVRKVRLNLKMEPVWVNEHPVGFC